ncbi:hypothetical protein BT67DRAFT_255181 [Trichocladium antarcticum]|uniref:Uncharacterized protein n=1 Tax=Trichocladium antarcticum TaxID=1450529 RepID=A0AAN6UMN6_9PEZI|nr:hypothetical protein BT67DRAFT_255181 [Trichocladium antarcticum]
MWISKDLCFRVLLCRGVCCIRGISPKLERWEIWRIKLPSKRSQHSRRLQGCAGLPVQSPQWGVARASPPMKGAKLRPAGGVLVPRTVRISIRTPYNTCVCWWLHLSEPWERARRARAQCDLTCWFLGSSAEQRLRFGWFQPFQPRRRRHDQLDDRIKPTGADLLAPTTSKPGLHRVFCGYRAWRRTRWWRLDAVGAIGAVGVHAARLEAGHGGSEVPAR